MLLMACFAGSVATYAKCGGIFVKESSSEKIS